MGLLRLTGLRRRWADMARLTSRFLGATSGNMVVFFGLLILPLVGVVGVSVDLARASSAKTRLGFALDATALAVMNAAAIGEDDLEELAEKFFAANYQDFPFGTPTLAPPVLTGENVTLRATAQVETTLMRLFNRTSLQVSAETQVTRVVRGIDVALVLDNTGSMYWSGKMGDMRDAALQLIEILYPESFPNGNIRTALVPFTTTVNVRDEDAFSWSWIDGSDANGGQARATWHGHNFVHVDSAGNIDPDVKVNHLDLFRSDDDLEWRGCVEMRPGAYRFSDDPPSGGQPDSLWVPFFWPDEPDCSSGACGSSSLPLVSSFPYESHYSNRSFVDDREFTRNSGTPKNNYGAFLDELNDHSADYADFLSDYGVNDVYDDEYKLRQLYVGRYDGDGYVGKYDEDPEIDEEVSLSDRNMRGPNSNCPPPITPLTDDKEDLEDGIEEMFALGGGGTNIPNGLAWGLRVLTPSEPFTEGKDMDDDDYLKAIVLLTDGNNEIVSTSNHNDSHYTGVGYLSDRRMGTAFDTKSKLQDELDRRMETLCSDVKAQGVRLYTITFQVGGDIIDVMRDCATEPKLFYDVQDGGKLPDVFKEIAVDLSNLRISK